MEAKVVVHMKGGKIHKGLTRSFDPEAETFYLLPAEGGGVPVRIPIADMKALFWVRDFVGDADFVARKDFAAVAHSGRRAVIRFRDGEEIWGTVAGEPGDADAGFFFYPADGADNNVKIFVVRSSLEELRIVG